MQVAEQIQHGSDIDAALELVICGICQQMERSYADGDIPAARSAFARLNHAVNARSPEQIARMEQRTGLLA